MWWAERAWSVWEDAEDRDAEVVKAYPHECEQVLGEDDCEVWFYYGVEWDFYLVAFEGDGEGGDADGADTDCGDAGEYWGKRVLVEWFLWFIVGAD